MPISAVAEGPLAHPAIEPGQSLREHLTRRRKSPICVVVERNGRPEHGEEAVAEVADQSPWAKIASIISPKYSLRSR